MSCRKPLREILVAIGGGAAVAMVTDIGLSRISRGEGSIGYRDSSVRYRTLYLIANSERSTRSSTEGELVNLDDYNIVCGLILNSTYVKN